MIFDIYKHTDGYTLTICLFSFIL